MSKEELYLNELDRQIDFIMNELMLLKQDYLNVNDFFAKTYIYDIIERKDKQLLKLLKERVNYGVKR